MLNGQYQRSDVSVDVIAQPAIIHGVQFAQTAVDGQVGAEHDSVGFCLQNGLARVFIVEGVVGFKGGEEKGLLLQVFIHISAQMVIMRSIKYYVYRVEEIE